MAFLPILSLSLAAFAIGTTEFAIQGLLPEIAENLQTSIPRAGLLVSAYALGVAIGGPIVVATTSRLERKTCLLILLSIFVIGHVLCAISPNYPTLLAGRIVASLCHGAFMGIRSVVVVKIAPADRRASAVALMWAGIASANIVGVPAGTAIGQIFGWRAAFWVIAGLGLAASLAVSIFLPRVERGPSNTTTEFRTLARPQIILVLLMAAFVCAATFSVFAYIAPLLIEVARIEPPSLPLYLLSFGIGGVIGMQVGGRFADRNVNRAVIAAFAADAIVYVSLLFGLRSQAWALPLMFGWGFAFYFIAAPLQLRLVDSARDASNLASTVIQSAFNFGIAAGPVAAAAALSFGVGYALLPICGLVFTLAGLSLALLSASAESCAGKTSTPDSIALEPGDRAAGDRTPVSHPAITRVRG
jgi:MFS transporter, DHA1 family, inner membrane transport protein